MKKGIKFVGKKLIPILKIIGISFLIVKITPKMDVPNLIDQFKNFLPEKPSKYKKFNLHEDIPFEIVYEEKNELNLKLNYQNP